MSLPPSGQQPPQPRYEVGQVVNGYRWTGTEWVPAQGAPQPGPPGVAPGAAPKPKRPLYKRWWVWVGGAVALLIIISAIAGGGGGDQIATPEPSSAASTEAPAAKPEPEPQSESAPEPTEEPDPGPKTQNLSGSGDKVIKLKKPISDPMLVTTKWRGSDGNTTIYALNSEGVEGDLLVNTIGSYNGTNIINIYDGSEVAAFKVEGSGSWTITLEPLSKAERWDGSGTFKGDSDDVVAVPGVFTGLDTLKFKSSKADGNVTVYGYGDEDESLIVNDIGNFSGEYDVPNGVSLLKVSSDGDWTMNRN